MARRAQRRDGHKEIAEQFMEDWLHLDPPPNMFSPVPIWLISKDERLGMEHFRWLRSMAHIQNTKGPNWWHHNRDRTYSTDATLFEDLQRSIKK